MTALATLPANAGRSSQTERRKAVFTICLVADARCGALARIVNLMSKLDIEPLRLESRLAPGGDKVPVEIDVGGGVVPAERLTSRLGSLVGLHRMKVRETGSLTLSPAAE